VPLMRISLAQIANPSWRGSAIALGIATRASMRRCPGSAREHSEPRRRAEAEAEAGRYRNETHAHGRLALICGPLGGRH
jgi:hypothetical protein